MVTTFDISPETRASLTSLSLSRPLPITGANGGIGLEAVRQLLDLGCKVILTELINGRDLAPEFFQVWKLHLSSYESIIAFAGRAKTLKSLDIAILSAGLLKVTESFSSSTGYEEGVQTNFLANMLLTVLLLPIIKEKRALGQPGHICEGNSIPVLPAFKRKSPNWNIADRYGATKLLGQLFLTELAKHVSSSVISLSCANPGFCSGSELSREPSGIVYAAHGQYVEDAKVQPPEGLRLSKQVYEETLDGLSFAGVRDIIDQVSKVR
ncbi:NAD(P)-binding protein [Daldinia bambusicola]|nr:NAD(P)-binding protein [Daldinia bambusicola]